MPMLAAVTCLARRRRMHCRGSDTAPAPALELDQGQHGLAGDHRHRWRDELAPASEETRLRRAPPSGRQGRRRLPRDGGPPALGSRRRWHQATVAAGAEQAPTTQEEARGQPGRGPSAAVASKKAASAPSSEGSSPAVLCAVCLEEVRRGEGEAASPSAAAEAMATTLPCSHSYHHGCVLPWLAAHGACPCCRAAVPSPAGELLTCEIDLE